MPETRAAKWKGLNEEWDLLIIGGGVTGAGLFRRAVSAGLRTLLIEARDYSYGTSSRSSKLAHGGLRYLLSKQWEVTRESVREREWLLKASQGLVQPMGFILPYAQRKNMAAQYAYGLAVYDLMAPKWKHIQMSRAATLQKLPVLQADWLAGSFLYYDSVLDDSRLVLRLIFETVQDGGTAMNYCQAKALLRDATGNVVGVLAEDRGPEKLGRTELRAKIVVNACGPCSDELRGNLGLPARIRPLRGAHLIFPHQVLPVPYAVTLQHPKDKRAMFAIPWEGSTLLGTTDLDHDWQAQSGEPYCSAEESEYILQAGQALFPGLGLNLEQVSSSFAGVRPIIRGDAANPSAESRAHVLWDESGLLTITGGKLTIFRIMAEDTMKAIAVRLGRKFAPMGTWFKAPMDEASPSAYLNQRHGPLAAGILAPNRPSEAERIPGAPNTWAELRFCAREEQVIHLDDLLLRRLRVGLLLPEGAKTVMPRVRASVQAELGWDDARWQAEEARYFQIYAAAYSPNPSPSSKGAR